jgi:hypothetical protein
MKVEELVRPGDMLIVEERIGGKYKLLVDTVRDDDTLADTTRELDDPVETSAEELEVEETPLREVERMSKTSSLKALTKLLPAVDKIPGLDFR